jgi:pimeloyl-ACP methyl ester carboxylesterase
MENAMSPLLGELKSPPITEGRLFDSAGVKGAPAIVLIHGSVVTRKMWLPQLAGLGVRYHVLAPDLPGHGAAAATPFCFRAAAERMAELIRQETAGRALVAGLSLGGYVAMELAQRSPELVAGLVLSGSSLNFEGPLAGYLKLAAWLIERGWIRLNPTQAEARVRRMFPPALAEVAEAQVRAGVYPAVLAPSYAELAGRDFRGVLAAYAGPSLILNGERDKAARRGAARFAAAARNARVQVVPGAGHACNLDQPDLFNKAVHEFAQSIGLG